MANEKNPPAQAAPAAAPVAAPNKSKKMVLAVLVGTILLFSIAAVGGLVWWWSKSGSDYDDDEQTISQKKPGSGIPPVFVRLDKFTVNLKPADDGSDAAYMQVDITLQVESTAAETSLSGLMPRIRNDLTLIMSDKQASFLITREGKEVLAEEIRYAINRIISPPRRPNEKPPEGPVAEVLFEHIIIQ
ncbi:MAG: flagellar basal body-associated FliL family protein [Betaproteobacteria bacterium]|nr:flagellar basal body-associated FliL family protein [Betaproteobacteria bacterium]